MTFIFFISLLKIFFKDKKNEKKNVYVNKNTNNNLLPPKPKEKWKYIKKLENL